MEHMDLILTLSVGLTAALICGFITFKIGLSPIVGYLLAGIAFGPQTPGFVANPELANQLAEIGIILLMFGVGLHFDLQDLLAVRGIAIPGAIVQSLVLVAIGSLLADTLGWSWQSGIVFGLTISFASTVVLTRVLSDNDQLHTSVGKIAIGWLVVQDLFAVLALVLIQAIFGENDAQRGPLAAVLGIAALKIAVLITSVFVLGRRLIPWVLRHVAATHSRELFTLSILAIVLSIAVGSTMLFGVSMALGAFLAGMVVGRSDFSVRAATEALPMRDAFAVLFFVSVGMLFDPSFLLRSPLLIAETAAIVMIGTPATVFLTVVLLRYPARTAVILACSLGQIGEFSFILATLAKKLKIIGDEANQTIVAVAILTISINPLLFRLTSPLESLARKSRWLRRRSQRPEHSHDSNLRTDSPSDPWHRAVIVGYGPVGRTLTRLVRENGIQPTIIEMNAKTAEALKSQRIAVVYGDASHRETLEKAGVAQSATLILSASGLDATEEVIRVARILNPDIRILVRTAYLREGLALKAVGADAIFSGEGEVALAMTQSMMTTLGATPEQIDRERDRLQFDLAIEEANLS